MRRSSAPKLARIAADSLFPIILVGHEEIAAGRKEKPDKSIFLSACRLAGCHPRQVRHTPRTGSSFAGLAGWRGAVHPADA